MADSFEDLTTVSDLQEYVVELGGVEHTFLLTEEEAKVRDAKPVQSKARAPRNKAREADNK